MSSKLILVHIGFVSSGFFILKTYNLATIYFWAVDNNPKKQNLDQKRKFGKILENVNNANGN